MTFFQRIFLLRNFRTFFRKLFSKNFFDGSVDNLRTFEFSVLVKFHALILTFVVTSCKVVGDYVNINKMTLDFNLYQAFKRHGYKKRRHKEKLCQLLKHFFNYLKICNSKL